MSKGHDEVMMCFMQVIIIENIKILQETFGGDLKMINFASKYSRQQMHNTKMKSNHL